jgi:hypothetical protein
MMETYINPIKKHGDFADPFILRYNGQYYLYCTNPQVRCWRSDDLLHWEYAGTVVPESELGDRSPFAPEVVYSEGQFYMYTSPDGLGHYVLCSSSPTGPFHKITDNIGHNIDLSVFVDDDGRWYAYWADDNGILGCEMSSPTQFGEPHYIGAYLHGWTEGPFVVKRNGKYHLTYTGNHYLSKGYRIHAAVSDHPLGPFHDNPRNPLLVRTEDGPVGLGHSSTVLGPDLSTYYIAYHNLNPDQTRDLNIDPILLCEDGAYVQGPSRTPQPEPLRPAWEDVFDEAGSGWEVCAGSWHVDGRCRSVNGPFRCQTREALPAAGAAEFHLALDSSQTCGILLGGVELTFRLAEGKVLLSGHSCQEEIPLPETFRPEALHRIYAEWDTAPGTVQLYLDGRRLPSIAADISGLPVGYFSDGGSIQIGYTAFSGKGENSPVFPVPAVLPNGADFRVSIPRSGTYTLMFPDVLSTPEVLLDGQICHCVAECSGQVTFLQIQMPSGIHRVTMPHVHRQAAEFYEQPPRQEETMCVENFGPFDKRHGKFIYTDGTIEATLIANEVHPGGQAGVLLRATALADGGEGGDKELGTNFFIGYRLSLGAEGISLWRHRYDAALLCRFSQKMTGQAVLRIEMRGDTLKVALDGKEVLSYRDPAPILYGYVGFHAQNCVICSGEIRAFS